MILLVIGIQLSKEVKNICKLEWESSK